MQDYDDRVKVGLAMRRWGGSFAQHLGEALLNADEDNTRKIADTWPEMWTKYLGMYNRSEEGAA